MCKPTGKYGEITRDETHMALFNGSGRQGPGWIAYTWDIQRADLKFVLPLKPVD